MTFDFDGLKVVGRRKPPSVSFDADAELLRTACAWNESMQRLPTGETAFFPKGVYRYKTHEEAQAHLDRCVAERMARIALERINHG
jgi:hypothetical protein